MGGGGNYLREVIILNISIKGGRFLGGDSWEAINWETVIIRGNMVVETLCPKGLFLTFCPLQKG